MKDNEERLESNRKEPFEILDYAKLSQEPLSGAVVDSRSGCACSAVKCNNRCNIWGGALNNALSVSQSTADAG